MYPFTVYVHPYCYQNRDVEGRQIADPYGGRVKISSQYPPGSGECAELGGILYNFYQGSLKRENLCVKLIHRDIGFLVFQKNSEGRMIHGETWRFQAGVCAAAVLVHGGGVSAGAGVCGGELRASSGAYGGVRLQRGKRGRALPVRLHRGARPGPARRRAGPCDRACDRAGAGERAGHRAGNRAGNGTCDGTCYRAGDGAGDGASHRTRYGACHRACDRTRYGTRHGAGDRARHRAAVRPWGG